MLTKAVILSAGLGTRMHSEIPKALHPLCGVPMIKILMESTRAAGINDITVVVGPKMDAVQALVAPFKTAVQRQQLGTGHAVLAAAKHLSPFDGCVMILFVDHPLILPQTLQEMAAKYQAGADVVVLGFIPPDTRRYGRLVMGESGLEKIVEYKDASDEERAIRLCNSGVMCVNGKHVLELLKKIKNNNAAAEYYLTDIVALARAQGLKCDVVIGDEEELHGINTPEELETAQAIFIKRKETHAS